MLGKGEQFLLTPGDQLSHSTETSQTVNQHNMGWTLSNLPTVNKEVNITNEHSYVLVCRNKGTITVHLSQYTPQ